MIYLRFTDNFRSWKAAKLWAWGYLPVVGGASLWSCVVLLMILHFLRECIEQFAQASPAPEVHPAACCAMCSAVRATWRCS